MIGRSWICLESTVVSAFICAASAKMKQSKEAREGRRKWELVGGEPQAGGR